MFSKIKRFLNYLTTFVFQKTLLPIFLTIIYFLVIGIFKFFLLFSFSEKYGADCFHETKNINIDSIEELENQS